MSICSARGYYAVRKKVPFDILYVDLSDKPEWLFELNPLGKVPILKLDESRVLFESTSINEFLDDTLAPRIQSSDPYQKALERAYIAIATELLWDLKEIYLSPDEMELREREKPFLKKISWIEDQIDKMNLGNSVTLSFLDIGFAPLFTHIQRVPIFKQRPIWQHLPKVSKWIDRVVANKSVHQSITNDFDTELTHYFKSRNGFLFK